MQAYPEIFFRRCSLCIHFRCPQLAVCCRLLVVRSPIETFCFQGTVSVALDTVTAVRVSSNVCVWCVCVCAFVVCAGNMWLNHSVFHLQRTNSTAAAIPLQVHTHLNTSYAINVAPATNLLGYHNVTVFRADGFSATAVRAVYVTPFCAQEGM